MPLIIVTGYPTAGKTHRANQLASYFESRSSTPPFSSSKPLRVHHITDTSLSIPHSVYNLESAGQHERSANASEKDARALVYAAVKRALSANDLVICDAAAGNYIKGWRYQLFCEAKALLTGCCVVHVGTGKEKARELNEERLRRRENGEDLNETKGEELYERDTWENLVFRYEEPNGMVRWDSPLFTVVWDDEAPPCEEIWTALVGSKDGKKVVIRPNQATVLKKATTEGYLYELDRATQEVVARIVEWGKDHVGEGGGQVSVGDGHVVELPSNPVGLPALQRLRRHYIGLQRQNPGDAARIKGGFVGYLNGEFRDA